MTRINVKVSVKLAPINIFSSFGVKIHWSQRNLNCGILRRIH
jgi:hypothetical protein